MLKVAHNHQSLTSMYLTLNKYLKQQKDSELVLTLDDKKEITGWEVINTKTHMSSEEAIEQSRHAWRVANNAAFKAMCCNSNS